ncbi:MAG: DHH family phosphoesterase [Thermoplasmatales archaeon]|nr:MAG: DHH family phosphoesterase [Thermoplasmatales archaeon]
MFEELKGKCLLIHHWDADGICSARLLLEYFSDKNIYNKTPEIGKYYLTEKELKAYSKYDFVIVADMSFPEENILKLAENSKVIIFDHHLGKTIDKVFHYNPIINGEDPNRFPSTSWVIKNFFGKEVNLFSILGIVGDHEQKIKNNKEFYDKIIKFCKKENLIFEDMLKMVYLLDSNYKIGDKAAVEKAPHQLLNIKSAIDILNEKKWNENLIKLNREISKFLDNPRDEIDGTVVMKINTPLNIISTVTRKVSLESGKNTIIINTGFFDDKDQLYLRSKKNAEPMIMRGKELNIKCGGKKEVLGATVPKSKTDFFLQEILDFLNKNNG